MRQVQQGIGPVADEIGHLGERYSLTRKGLGLLKLFPLREYSCANATPKNLRQQIVLPGQLGAELCQCLRLHVTPLLQDGPREERSRSRTEAALAHLLERPISLAQ